VKKRLWIAGIVLVLFAAYTLGGFYGVPRLARNELIGYFKGIHREAQVGEIRFNPFTLEAEVKDFTVPDTDGTTEIAFRRFYVNFSPWASLWRRGYVLQALTLEGPRINVIRRADGAVNLVELRPPSHPVAGATKAGTLPRMFVDVLTVSDGQIGLEDRTRSPALKLAFNNFGFAISDFATSLENNRYALTATSSRGEVLAWQGTFGVQPVESQGEFRITALRAKTIEEVGAGQLPVDLATGTIDLNGSYQLAEPPGGLDLKATLAQVAVQDLRLRAHGVAEDWVILPKLTVADTRFDLAGHSVTVGDVLLEEPQVNAWRDHDGSINLAKMAGAPANAPAAPASKAPAPPAAASAPAWRVAAPSLRIRRGVVNFEDRVPATIVKVTLHPVDITVKDFALPLKKPVALDASIGVAPQGEIKASGLASLSPVSAQLAIQATALQLAPFQPYLENETLLLLKGGTLSSTLKVDYGADSGVRAQGQLAVNDLHTQDRHLNEDFVNWKSFTASGIDLHTAPFALKVRDVVTRGLYARVTIAADRTTNIQGVLLPNAQAKSAPATPDANAGPTEQPTVAVQPAARKPRASKAATAPPARPPPASVPVEIGVVRLVDGSVNFADLSVQPNFATGILDLNGTISPLSGRLNNHAKIDLAGKVDRYAPVTIGGEIQPFAYDKFLDLHMKFENLDLTRASPYSGKFAGYKIAKGKMTMDITYHIVDRQLQAQHHIVVDQLELGEKVDSPEATHLPVKLAIALLKDSNGVIDLPLPVDGNLDDPNFHIGPVIFKVVVNLLTKIVTSPFKLLGSLFGGGETLNIIEFAPGSAAIDPAASSKIESLRKAMSSRPALKLEIPEASCPDADGAALAARGWQDAQTALARAELGKHADDPGAVEALLRDPKHYRSALLHALERAGIPAQAPAPAQGASKTDAQAAEIAAYENALKEKVAVVGPAALEALGRARADSTQSALIADSGIDPARVFLLAKVRAKCAPGAPVGMELALQ
jgi:uncharacterized protein involved in outer membrane biogenesis